MGNTPISVTKLTDVPKQMEQKVKAVPGAFCKDTDNPVGNGGGNSPVTPQEVAFLPGGSDLMF